MRRHITATAVAVLAFVPVAACGSMPELPATQSTPAERLHDSVDSWDDSGSYSYRITGPAEKLNGVVSLSTKSYTEEMENWTFPVDPTTSPRLRRYRQGTLVTGSQVYWRAESSAGVFGAIATERALRNPASIDDGKDPWLEAGATAVDFDKKFPGIFNGKHWVRITAVKDCAREQLDPGTWGPAIGRVISSAEAVKSADASTITGTVEASTLKEYFLGVIDRNLRVPFTAVLDARGRLTHFETSVPKSKDTDGGTFTVQVSGFGTSPKTPKPAGATELPAAAIAALNR